MDVPLGANIQAAVDANPSGTIFRLSPGVYRLQTVRPKEGDQLLGALGSNGERLTTLSGAQMLTSFTRDGYGNYVATTTQTQPGQQTGECLGGYSRCTLPEDLFYDNQPYLHSAGGPALLAPGQYYFDYPNGRIYFKPKNLADDPTQHTVEYSRSRTAVSGQFAPNVVVKNLIVEKYASPNQFAAVGDQYPGQGWVIQNNEVRWNHGVGLRIDTNGQAIDNYTHDNGTMGVAGSGRNLLVQGNEIARNAFYIGTYCEFECGGTKFTNTDGLTVRGNFVHDNFGPGLWTDLDNIRVIYENNTVTNNTGAGIFHEISYDSVMRYNTIRNNGVKPADDWFWNAQIMISTSMNVEIYGNIVEYDSNTSSNGIMLIQQNRTNDPCSYGECRIINSSVHDNHITVRGTRRHGSNGAVQDFKGYGDIFAPSSNNRFDANHYHVTNVNSDGYWVWIDNFQFWPWLKPLNMEVNGTVDSNMSADFSAPSVPSSLNATVASASAINLSWAPSSDDVGVTGYRIYRNGAQIATSTSTSYLNGGLAAGVSYSYTVAAFDAAGNVSAQSAATSAFLQASGDSTAPSVPGTPGASAVSPTQINLSWAASTDNTGVTGYRVYRNGELAGISTIPSYADTGLNASTTYSYSVSAYDAAGNVSAPSGTTSATTPGTAVLRVGARVVVNSAVAVRSRAGTNGPVVGDQQPGSTGSVVRAPGPGIATGWWFINFDSGADGWVPQNSISAF